MAKKKKFNWKIFGFGVLYLLLIIPIGWLVFYIKPHIGDMGKFISIFIVFIYIFTPLYILDHDNKKKKRNRG
ncbi:MAG: hypothetical protein V1866_04780 [archaeon]